MLKIGKKRIILSEADSKKFQERYRKYFDRWHKKNEKWYVEDVAKKFDEYAKNQNLYKNAFDVIQHYKENRRLKLLIKKIKPNYEDWTDEIKLSKDLRNKTWKEVLKELKEKNEKLKR